MSGSSKSDGAEFLEKYSQDQLAATLEVLRYQHDFLYQTFHKSSSGSKSQVTFNLKTMAAQRRQSIRMPAAKSGLIEQIENQSNSEYLKQMIKGRAR